MTSGYAFGKEPDQAAFGERLEEKSLVPLGKAHLGLLNLEEWDQGNGFGPAARHVSGQAVGRVNVLRTIDAQPR